MTDQPGRPPVGKASFDDLYDLDDPREYLRTLRRLDYRTPHHAQPIITSLTRALRRRRAPVTITDLCCSYGIIAALVKHALTLDDLYDRYTGEPLAGLSTDELADADELYYKDHRLPDAPRVVGIDVASRAVAYALRVGLLDDGAGENLEEGDPSRALAAAVAPTDLVTVTGGVGYISGRSFARVLDAVEADHVPWVAAFPLRITDFGPIAAVLADRDLVTERHAASFPQRRFVDDEERARVLRGLHDRGLDPSGREGDGYHHVDFYLARPREDVESSPLADLVPGAGPGPTGPPPAT